MKLQLLTAALLAVSLSAPALACPTAQFSKDTRFRFIGDDGFKFQQFLSIGLGPEARFSSLSIGERILHLRMLTNHLTKHTAELEAQARKEAPTVLVPTPLSTGGDSNEPG